MKKRKWTAEEKAAFRKTLPEKLNKLGEWFFSEDADKEYFRIVDEEAVLE
ncbi:MAG: hypothetical protein LUC44_02665 [Prevotellaceae bacterium]|nr:hypothetical protein [Prevotellaceae bacterium]